MDRAKKREQLDLCMMGNSELETDINNRKAEMLQLQLTYDAKCTELEDYHSKAMESEQRKDIVLHICVVYVDKHLHCMLFFTYTMLH